MLSRVFRSSDEASDWISHHFKRDGKNATCEHCGQSFQWKLSRCKEHLARSRGNIGPCPSVPDGVRKKAKEILDKEDAQKGKKKRTQDGNDDARGPKMAREKMPLGRQITGTVEMNQNLCSTLEKVFHLVVRDEVDAALAQIRPDKIMRNQIGIAEAREKLRSSLEKDLRTVVKDHLKHALAAAIEGTSEIEAGQVPSLQPDLRMQSAVPASIEAYLFSSGEIEAGQVPASTEANMEGGNFRGGPSSQQSDSLSQLRDSLFGPSSQQSDSLSQLRDSLFGPSSQQSDSLSQLRDSLFGSSSQQSDSLSQLRDSLLAQQSDSLSQLRDSLLGPSSQQSDSLSHLWELRDSLLAQRSNSLSHLWELRDSLLAQRSNSLSQLRDSLLGPSSQQSDSLSQLRDSLFNQFEDDIFLPPPPPIDYDLRKCAIGPHRPLDLGSRKGASATPRPPKDEAPTHDPKYDAPPSPSRIPPADSMGIPIVSGDFVRVLTLICVILVLLIMFLLDSWQYRPIA